MKDGVAVEINWKVTPEIVSEHVCEHGWDNRTLAQEFGTVDGALAALKEFLDNKEWKEFVTEVHVCFHGPYDKCSFGDTEERL